MQRKDVPLWGMRCPNFVNASVFRRRTAHVAQEHPVERTARGSTTLGNNRVDGVLRMLRHQATGIIHAPMVDALSERLATAEEPYGACQVLLVRAKLRGKRRPVQIAPEKSPLFRQIAEKTLENKRKRHIN